MLGGDQRVTVRPVCPWEGDRVQAYVRGLSPSSRYDRFLGPVNELTAAELDRVTRGDDRWRALIAETIVDGGATVIGEARYAVAADGRTCEIAVSVADAWRGRGVGSLLMRDLECRAQRLGVSMLVGDVLRTNAAMQGLARKAGFALTGVPAEARLVRIVKDLADPQRRAPCAQLAASGFAIAA